MATAPATSSAGCPTANPDHRLVDLADDDGVPEVAIGRLPVLTSEELLAYVQKVAACEAAAGAGWSDRVFLVADDNPYGLGDFRQESDSMAALLPPTAVVERLYLAEQPAAVVRQRLVAGIGEG